MVSYLVFRAWKGVSRVKEKVTRITEEKIQQGNFFKHPLYTFCPEFKDVIDNVITLQNGEEMNIGIVDKHEKVVPTEFVISVTDGY